MGELIQSLIRFSIDLSAFAFRQMANLIGPGQMPSGGTQSNGAIGSGPSSLAIPTSVRKPDATAVSVPRIPARSGRLNTRNFMVLGEGFTAGMGDFELNEVFQRKSFPAQMAEAMGVDFRQALIQEPGIGNLVGFPHAPVSVPAEMQTTFLSDLFNSAPRNDLSIPGLSVPDCVELRSRPPLVCLHDARQTIANFVLGMPGFATSGDEGMTQLEYAVRHSPTFAIVALGFREVLCAAVQGNAALLPEAQSFVAPFTRIIRSLKDAGSEVMVMNIPDPLDAPWFNSVEAAGKVLRADPEVLRTLYHPEDDDRITLPGLVEIGNQILGKSIRSLSPEHVLQGGVAAQITAWVDHVNRELALVAAEHGALCYELRGFIRNIRTSGCSMCPRSISGEFLGGFYSLNGFYPGPSGNAILANDVLTALNRTYGSEFPMIDACKVMRSDPVAMYEPAKGLVWTTAHLAALQQPATVMSAISINDSPQPSGDPSSPGAATNLRLPDGLEQVLPLCFDSSYFGEAIRAVNCQDEQTAIYGSSPTPLFGGLILVDSHLRGNLRIKFTPPVNDITRFQVSFESGLVGNDSTLVAPNFYRFPFQQNGVQGVPGQACSGTLNLATGEVNPADLKFSFAFTTTGLGALAQVNPKFPRIPIAFPGDYGTASASFEQRPDGKLDFSFYGTTFLPLWKALGPMRFPLPFAGPTLEFATIPANGTAMHPHIRLSTKNLGDAPVPAEPVSIPCNTIQEYTLFAHNSCFGDHFSLNIPEFGGDATGRSQLMGRLRLQFGEKSGNSVPVAVSLLTPGGALHPMSANPITQAFPGRLSPGPHGFDEFLRFPLRTYFLETVSFFDDPFDLSMGAVDVNTGQFIGGLLHRGFLAQDVFFALVRIEPRTPRSSFLFAGPASLENGKMGQSIFRLQSITRLPYPEGFLFPQPDLATGYVVGPGSFLEPYLWVQAIGELASDARVLEGEALQVLASNGNTFSYRYSLSNGSCGRQFFEYVNHSQEGRFRLNTLIWVKFMNSSRSDGRWGEYDTLTFAGFGTWSKGGVEKTSVVTVQISNPPDARYVGIQVEAGEISDVNTKPPLLSDATP